MKKLHQLGIVEPKNLNEVCSLICCNPVTENCLFRNCSKCNRKKLTFKSEADEMLGDISYYQWNTTKKSVMVKGKKNILEHIISFI